MEQKQAQVANQAHRGSTGRPRSRTGRRSPPEDRGRAQLPVLNSSRPIPTNIEIKRAPDGTEQAPVCSPDLKSQLAAIGEFSNDAIFNRTFDGIITTWNYAAERMFGYTPDTIIGRSSRVLLPSGRLEEFRDLVKQIRAGQKVQHFETTRLRKDGSQLQVSLALSPIIDSAGRLIGISTIAREISEQRRLREALARSERQLADLFEEASVGLMWLSSEGIILRANRALLTMLQCGPNECIECPLSQFHADAAVIGELLAWLANRETLRNFATEFRTVNGEIRHVLIDANAFWEHGEFVHARCFVRDISQRKRLEREVLELSDRERRCFAQELHDGLGQQLGGIAYLANVLHEQLVERRAPEAGEAERIFVLVRNAIEQTRRLARGLSPIGGDAEGLANALRELAAQTQEVFKVVCRFRCRQLVSVEDPVLAGHLYRIAQEAVNNALKHSEAQIIEIRLHSCARHLILAVRDNGHGIGILSPRRSGLGLRIMQYRAELIRAHLTVRRRPHGKGTEVHCVAPCSIVNPGSRDT